MKVELSQLCMIYLTTFYSLFIVYLLLFFIVIILQLIVMEKNLYFFHISILIIQSFITLQS